MVAAPVSLETLFCEALELANDERAAFLDRATEGNPALRAEVEALLAAHRKAGVFLEGPAPLPTVPWNHSTAIEAPGTVIGPYVLCECLGEGGMGIVYRAEQMEPIHRTVALKIVKPGMDTRQVISRFEAERQALALMDHPNIAKVLDAGATAPDTLPPGGGGPGRGGCLPYFVMELVDGAPITDYCDQNRLTITERLDLFVLVCRAVQHAHQKGIIHRDLKPSNVLFSQQDGVPVPKVIDFGIAKATGPRLTEGTRTTGLAPIVGTPAYMSPEQATVLRDDWSDAWSFLGVVHYRLGHLDQAEQAIRTALQRTPDQQENPFDPLMLALIHARRGDRERALAEFETYLALPKENLWMIERCESLEAEARALLGLPPTEKAEATKRP